MMLCPPSIFIWDNNNMYQPIQQRDNNQLIFFSSAFSPGGTGETAVITRDPSGYSISVALGLDEPVPAPPVVPKPDDPKLKADGRSISMTDKERKLFMNQFKTYSKKNNKIKTMKQYIKYIMKHQNEFMNKTVNRAETYSTM